VVERKLQYVALLCPTLQRILLDTVLLLPRRGLLFNEIRVILASLFVAFP